MFSPQARNFPVSAPYTLIKQIGICIIDEPHDSYLKVCHIVGIKGGLVIT